MASDVPYYWIDSTSALADVLGRHRDGAPYALDTEFMMGRTYFTRLALVQLGWPDEIALVDATKVDLSLLADLFDSDALALTHAGLNDFDVLDAVVGRRPRRFFDTQVAAQLLGWTMPSLAGLTSDLLDVTLDKSEQRTDWLVRPLSDAALAYAASDVAHLHELRTLLSEKLTAQGRLAWCEEECATQLQKRRVELRVEQLWWQLPRADTMPAKNQLLAQRLCAARDELARELDKTPSSLLGDPAIVALLKRPPRSVDDVFKAAGAKPAHRGFANEVVAIFKSPGDPATLEKPPSNRLDDELTPLLNVLGALATQRARDLDIDAGLVASKNDLTEYLRGGDSKLHTQWRRDCLTNDLDRLLRGDAHVSVRGNLLAIT